MSPGSGWSAGRFKRTDTRNIALWLVVAAPIASPAGCSAIPDSAIEAADETEEAGHGGPSSSSDFDVVAAGSGESGACVSSPYEDKDKDGWSLAAGDCQDCDPNVNPSAIDVIATGEDGDASAGTGPADEDCDGLIDNAPAPCDEGLSLEVLDPMDAAKAVELCKVAAGSKDWGILS